MTMAAQEPVVSGQWYTVTEVDGRPPTGLASCVGERVLILAMNGLSHRIFGTGVEHSAGVRFHQRDLGPDGKDVRVWTISDPGDNSLLAEDCAASCGSGTRSASEWWVAGNPVRGGRLWGAERITLMPGPLPRNPPTRFKQAKGES